MIIRESKGSQTNIGIFKRFEIPKEINLIPYGKQEAVCIKPQIICENILSEFVAVTLYKQRNGRYKMKLKNTSVSLKEE